VSSSGLALPPGPPRHLIAGNLPELARDRLGCLTSYAREYGDVVPLRIGTWRYLLLSHPDAIEEVLVGANRSFVKGREYRLNRMTLGHGLLTSDGDFWLRQRRLMQPAFRRDAVLRHASAIIASAEKTTSTWQDGATIDFQAAMLRLTLGAAAQTLFGADLEGRQSDVSHGLAVALGRFRERFDSLVALPDRLPTPANLRLRRAVRRLDRVVYSLIADRRGSDRDFDDLLSLLLAAQEEDGTRMTDSQLRDEVVTLLLAGHETTANALVWTWYLLAQHPDHQQQVADEVAAVLDGRAPTADSLGALRYVDMAVRESLRLYPPSWGITRQAARDCIIAGYPVRSGTHVAMCQWIVHRDRRWYDDPEQFRPERFADPSTSELPRYAYFPFGGGQRICIGAPFATLELVLIVAMIAQRFRLEWAGEADVRPVASVTLRPGSDMPMTVHRR
jgi:cytochrome P450